MLSQIGDLRGPNPDASRIQYSIRSPNDIDPAVIHDNGVCHIPSDFAKALGQVSRLVQAANWIV